MTSKNQMSMFSVITPFEISNVCTCTIHIEETDEDFPSEDCFGDCWAMAVDHFTEITSQLFDKNETGFWKISNLRLWDGNHDGFVYANEPLDLIRGMSVKSEWIMRGFVEEDRITYSLSHHDAPMGSNSTVTIVTEEEREEYGLY